jgi:hypothetical protein
VLNEDQTGKDESFPSAYSPKEIGTLDDFLTHVQTLPDQDDPEVCGNAVPDGFH